MEVSGRGDVLGDVAKERAKREEAERLLLEERVRREGADARLEETGEVSVEGGFPCTRPWLGRGACVHPLWCELVFIHSGASLFSSTLVRACIHPLWCEQCSAPGALLKRPLLPFDCIFCARGREGGPCK
jgi:hypothetical protein